MEVLKERRKFDEFIRQIAILCSPNPPGSYSDGIKIKNETGDILAKLGSIKGNNFIISDNKIPVFKELLIKIMTSWVPLIMLRELLVVRRKL